MVDIWRAAIPTTTYSTTSAKSLIGVFNGAGSGRVLRVLRIWHISNGIVGIGSGSVIMVIAKTKANSGGVVLRPAAHSSSNLALPNAIVCGSNQDYVDTATVRQYYRSIADYNSSTQLLNLWQVDVPSNLVWNAGYNSSGVQPIILREGEGLHVRQSASVASAQASGMAIEFTNEAS